MKSIRILSLLMALLMVLTIVACNKTTEEPDTTAETKVETEAPTTEKSEETTTDEASAEETTTEAASAEETTTEETTTEENKPALDTPAAIVEAAYALADGTTLESPVTLTGVVISSTYNSKYGDASIYFIVDGMIDLPMYAYRATGANTADVKPGSTVTITGTVKNYKGLIEFDKPTLDAVVEGSEDDIPAYPKTSPAEIIEDAFKLVPGRALGGLFTLTGVVTSCTYNPLYGDANIYIVIEGCEDKPLYCYQAKGNEAANVKVGDTITVKGMIKNHQGTVELDNPRILSRVEGSLDDLPGTSDPAEILNAAYALNDGESITGVFTLTGTVTIYQYNSEYGDAGITIVVEGFEDKPMFCFQTKGTGVETIKVGDVITVTATTIKNYMGTIEFDKPGLVAINP